VIVGGHRRFPRLSVTAASKEISTLVASAMLVMSIQCVAAGAMSIHLLPQLVSNSAILNLFVPFRCFTHPCMA